METKKLRRGETKRKRKTTTPSNVQQINDALQRESDLHFVWR